MMTDKVTIVVAGNAITLTQAQVQGLVDIRDYTKTTPERLLIANAANVPNELLPSYLLVRRLGYYPKTAIVEELGMATELSVFLKYTTVGGRDVMRYGSYTAYNVKQVSEFRYGGDGFALQAEETSDAFRQEDDSCMI